MNFKSPRQAAEVYERRSEKTYISRLEFYRSLERWRTFARLATLVVDASALFLLIAPAVRSFPFSAVDNPSSYVTIAVAMTVFQVCTGQFVQYWNLDTRIESVKRAYIDFQRISQNFEFIKGKPGLTMREVQVLVEEYQRLLSVTENHSPKHYKKVFS